MKKERPIGVGCNVMGNGRVMPLPGYRGQFAQDGPYSGNCRFTVYPGYGNEPDLIIAKRRAESTTEEEEEEGRILLSRTAYRFYLAEQRKDGYHNFSGVNPPVVGPHTYTVGNYSSVQGWAGWPADGPDPALFVSDLTYGWPITAYTDPPYYPLTGFWVLGFDPPFEVTGSDLITLPWYENLAVEAMRTISFTDGGFTYDNDIQRVTVREYYWSDQDITELYEYP